MVSTKKIQKKDWVVIEDLKNNEAEMNKRLIRVERRASELDTTELPISEKILDWREFNTNLYSTQHTFNEIIHLIKENRNERIDLRPYMIVEPFVCMTTDKMQKVLDMYRMNQMRQLCVINPVDGSLQGVIAREDLFAYMSM